MTTTSVIRALLLCTAETSCEANQVAEYRIPSLYEAGQNQLV